VAQTAGVTLPEPTPKTPADVAAEGRPENVPEKFWDAGNRRINVEALLKSYTELEKMKSKAADPEPKADEKPAVEAPKADEKPTEGDEKPTEASPVGDLINDLASKYEAGTFGEDDFKAAEAAGFPRQMVETYFAGLKALEATQTLALETAAGGKDILAQAREWAAKDLSDGDLEFYNTNLGNPKTAESAVKWLVDRFKAANPGEGRLVTDGSPASAPSGDVFRSSAEVTAAMSDPKYRTDPAFRQAVAEKLARSKQAGTYTTGAQYFAGSR
jgi:hypothetical protein